MASSDSERSIAGISLPQWMKNKINDRYDLDQSSFSPPTEDDSFFYIKYPKKEAGPKHIEHESNSAYHSISDVLEKHTLSCQEFIPAAKTTPRELGMKRGAVYPPLGVSKSTGTDDGFRGVGAACGHSVVAMAHQIVAARRPQQQSSDSDEEGVATPPDSTQLTRRGSKSLPASPRTSPKSLRKNPYFSNVLLGSSDNITTGKQGWFFSYVRENESLCSSVTDLKINEENEPPAIQPVIVKPKQTFAKPKPSQLREMNFWSPTSM